MSWKFAFSLIENDVNRKYIIQLAEVSVVLERSLTLFLLLNGYGLVRGQICILIFISVSFSKK